jgi:hypothetical protein
MMGQLVGSCETANRNRFEKASWFARPDVTKDLDVETMS